MLSTGFDVIDYLNGNLVSSPDGKKKYNVGIDAGKIMTIIGKTGVGKSTLALQIAANIIRRYDQSSLFVLDFEQSNSKDRIRSITGMSEEEFEQKVSIKKIAISTETVLEIASQIKKLKLERKEDLLTPNKEGILDEKGKVKKILPPTVIFVDSIAMMMPREAVQAEEMTGQMNATQMAKANTQLDV
jgi:predicted ATP-dependent serine protease